MKNAVTDSFRITISVKYLFLIFIAILILQCKTTDTIKSSELLPVPSYIFPLSTIGDAEWDINKGTISCDKGEGFFQTTKKFQYFDLSVDFKPEGDVNSGIFIGCEGMELSATGCYEINIWDNHPNQSYRTGAIVTRATPVSLVNTVGAWNTYVIRVRPEMISVFVNGIMTANLKPDKNINPSPIAFQKFGVGKISFRNFVIKRIE